MSRSIVKWFSLKKWLLFSQKYFSYHNCSSCVLTFSASSTVGIVQIFWKIHKTMGNFVTQRTLKLSRSNIFFTSEKNWTLYQRCVHLMNEFLCCWFTSFFHPWQLEGPVDFSYCAERGISCQPYHSYIFTFGCFCLSVVAVVVQCLGECEKIGPVSHTFCLFDQKVCQQMGLCFRAHFQGPWFVTWTVLKTRDMHSA